MICIGFPLHFANKGPQNPPALRAGNVVNLYRIPLRFTKKRPQNPGASRRECCEFVGVKRNDERYMFCDSTPAPEHACGPDPEKLFLSPGRLAGGARHL